MARECAICGKGTTTGNKVSHANNKSRTKWYPNLQRVRAIRDGVVRRIMVCTRCIRSNWVTKAA